MADVKDDRKNSMEQNLLRVNNLKYSAPDNLSVCRRRTLKKFFSESSNYTPSRNIVIDLQAGSDYILGRSSYLTIVVRNDGDQAFSWGVGSAWNLIKNVCLVSRNGVEIDRITDLNLYRAMRDRWENSPEWFENEGLLEGYTKSGGTPDAIPGTPAAADARTRTYVLPLHKLSYFFAEKKMLPPQLVSGLRVQILLDTGANAPKWALAPTSPDYVVVRADITLDACQLSDGAVKALTNESGRRDGLQFPFKSVSTTIQSLPASSGDISLDGRKAVSLALAAYVARRQSSDIDNAITDSFKQYGFDYSNYQFRLGSLYFPNQPLTTPEEGYKQVLYTFKESDMKTNNDVKVGDYRSTSPPSSGRDGIASVLLERGTGMLERQGLPVNNSRILAFNATAITSSDATTLHMFMDYVRIATGFVNNVVLEE